ncbi:OLC1v1036240C1 [Oldenlandia corymbosa var. corymbosa]|uniref:OLC1v1036240C1 n=1 Tax=Oldenlandia corymbosa var. corymbosa TaxID=529605 RepID=A0AAV1CVN5_OLDCO|nr:OLC1v1036240C1 [Oldenlandia corymbosa var. corymbosa]
MVYKSLSNDNTRSANYPDSCVPTMGAPNLEELTSSYSDKLAVGAEFGGGDVVFEADLVHHAAAQVDEEAAVVVVDGEQKDAIRQIHIICLKTTTWLSRHEFPNSDDAAKFDYLKNSAIVFFLFRGSSILVKMVVRQLMPLFSFGGSTQWSDAKCGFCGNKEDDER